MIVEFTLRNGAKRPALVVHQYAFGDPAPDKPGQVASGVPSNAIWDRRHEGVADLLVFLDPFEDRAGEAYDGTQRPRADGLILPVQHVVFDAGGAPGTYSVDVPVPAAAPPQPTTEFLTAQADAIARGVSLSAARAHNSDFNRQG